MILTKKIKIKAFGINLKHYRNLGYNVSNGDFILIPIEHMFLTSRQEITVKCDICGTTKELAFSFYNKNIKSYGFYSCSSKCSSEKKKNTFLKNYGVKFISQSQEIKNKKKILSQNKYGCDNPAQSKEVKDKIKNTNLDKYGVESTFQTQSVIDKSKKTILERYGVEYILQNKDILNKQQNTTLLSYGVKNASQSEKIKKQKSDTCLKNYGVENPAQNRDVFDKQVNSGYKVKLHKNTNLYYQGTYENHFLDYCYKNNIEVKRGPTVEYIFKNKKHYYFSDFFIEKHNLIIEIKSNHYFNMHKKLNLTKQKYSLKEGFNFLFIIDKNYLELEKLIFLP